MPNRFKIVADSDAADFDSVRVTLFRSTEFYARSQVCGWYISPVRALPVAYGYVSPSANLIASCAVIRAVAVAERLGVEVCIIDPDDLWDEAWGRASPPT